MTNSKKRICLVVASPLSIRFYLTGYIATLAAKYDLTVITNTDTPDFLACLGVPLTVIPVGMERNVSIWRDLKALTRLVSIFQSEKFDIVHSHTPKSGLLAMVAAWITGTPVRIHTFHGEVWVTRKGFWRALLKFFDKTIGRLSTHLLVVGPSERQFLIDQGVVRAGKLQILANGSICGVDTARFKPDLTARNEIRKSIGIPQEDVVVLFLGRLAVDKGLLDLAEAFSMLGVSAQQVHLLLVGPDEEHMRQKIDDRCGSGSRRLHFVDYTDNPAQYMAAADILCLPSYREGFPLVLIEAAATGLATIGSNIYGITDAVVDCETGLLFKPRDVNDLAEKMQRLIDSPELRRRLGENGRARVHRDFSRELVLAEVLKFYDKVFSA